MNSINRIRITITLAFLIFFSVSENSFAGPLDEFGEIFDSHSYVSWHDDYEEVNFYALKKNIAYGDCIEIRASNFGAHGYSSEGSNWLELSISVMYSIGGAEYEPVSSGYYVNSKKSWAVPTNENPSGGSNDHLYIRFYDKWDSKAYIATDKLIENNFEKGTTIVFKIEVGGTYNPKKMGNKELQKKTILIPIYIYKCSAGTIKTDESVTPNIGDGSSPIYGIYNSDNGSKYLISDVVSPNNLGLAGEYVTYRIQFEDTFSRLSDACTKNITSLPPVSGYDWNTTYGNYSLRPHRIYSGAKRYVKREYNSSVATCSSNTLTFQAVDTLRLDGFDESEREQYICPFNMGIIESGGQTCESKNTFHLKGKEIDWEAVNETNFDRNKYGVVYNWQYRTSTNGTWMEIPDDSRVKSDIDLCLKKEFFSDPNKTYYFRQVVDVTKFNRKVYADGEHKYVSVKVYKAPTLQNFTVKELPKYCQDDLISDTLLVRFDPNGGKFCSFYGEDDPKPNNFKFTYATAALKDSKELNGENIGTELSVPFSMVAKKGFETLVTVEDGCGNKTEIKAPRSLVVTVNEKPTLQPDYFDTESGSIDPSSTSSHLKVSAPDGKNITLVVNENDPEKGLHNYYISFRGTSQDATTGEYGWEERKPINRANGYTIPASFSDHPSYKADPANCIKVEKVGRADGCTSEPMYISISYVGRINANTIYFADDSNAETSYVCKNGRNKAIGATAVSGGYGAEGEYSFLWQYSNDNVSWVNMTDDKGDYLTNFQLKENEWNRPIDNTYYVRRLATSKKADAPDGSSVQSFSNVLKLQPYTRPAISLLVDGKKDKLREVCFSQTVELSCAIANKAVVDAENYDFKADGFGFAYEKQNGEKAPFDEKTTKISVDKDSIIYATANFCGETIYSANHVELSVGENLTKGLAVSMGSCRVRGENMTLTIGSAAPNLAYAFVYDGDTLQGVKATVRLPKENTDVNYQVEVTDGVCSQTKNIKVDRGNIKEPLKSGGLVVFSDGAKELATAGDSYSTCAGEVIKVTGRNEATRDDVTYEWFINDNLQDPSLYKTPLLNTSLEALGKTYSIIRTTSIMVNGSACQSVDDTVKVSTYGNITGIKLEIPRDTFCFGEAVKKTINTKGAKGGSGEYRYDWYRVGKSGETQIDSKASATYKETQAVENAIFRVVASDAKCTSSAYRYTAESRAVTVEKDLTFKLAANPSQINKQELAGGKTKSVTITAAEIDPTDKVDIWLTGNKLKSDETYVNGITYPVKEENFKMNFAKFTVTRYGTVVKKCQETDVYQIALNDGFDSQPNILSSGSDESPTVVCGGEKVTLSVDTKNLPKYANATVPASSFSYQWYTRVVGDTVWSKRETKNSIEVTAASGVSREYRCKLSFTPAGGTEQSVVSEIFGVVGTGVPSIGRVSFKKEGKLEDILYVCRGESGNVVLTTSMDTSKVKVRWQWMQQSAGGEWQKVPMVGSTLNATEATCSIDLRNYSENTSFKVVATDGCGVTSESENVLMLLFNGGTLLREEDIFISSSTITDGETLDSVVVNVPRDNSSEFFWTANPTLKEWKPGNPAVVKNGGNGFPVGLDSLFVYKVSSGQGNCLSDTIVFHFNTYKKLTANPITLPTDTVCKTNKWSDLNLNLNFIQGGDEKYKIEWYYKSKNMKGFSPVTAESSMPFIYDNLNEGLLGSGGYSHLVLRNMRETCSFYAVVRCLGDYPGGKYETNVVTRHVYDDLKPGGIDVKTGLACYGDAVTEIAGADAEGGTGDYNYLWLKAEIQTDGSRGKWSAVSDQTQGSYKGRSGQESNRLKKTTFFCRVTDDGCSRDTSKVKTIQVGEEVRISPDDIIYTRDVERGSRSTMYGVSNQYDYVWYDETLKILDTLGVRETYETDVLKEAKATYYAKAIMDGCLSTNYDTITINTYELAGGHLTFNEYDGDGGAKPYWICSGGKAGGISVDGSGDMEYRWYYKVNNEEKDNLLYDRRGKAVTTSNVDLDTCSLANAFANASGTEKTKRVSFFRTTHFNFEGNGKHVESDTVSIFVVPTLSKVSSLLLDESADGTMAGVLECRRTTYCPGESGEAIEGTPSENLYSVLSNGGFGPYIYDPQAPEFTTWFEVGKGNEWTKDEVHHGIMDYAENFYIQELDTTYKVRRGFSDGCSTIYSNTIPQNLSNRKANPEKLFYKGMTPEGAVVTECFEMGDEMTINYAELGYGCYWFKDEACTDTLAANNQLLNLGILGEETPTTVYLKRKDNNDCFSTAIAVPLTFYTKSDGGIIYKDQTACAGTRFAEIVGGKRASGYACTQGNGAARVFSYQWQICSNTKTNVWTDIEGATDADKLTEEQLNASIHGTLKNYYVRRKATNECGRECFSNVVTLTYFDAFEGGSIALENTKKRAFCYTDTFPTVVTTTPTGGYFGHEEVDGYSYGWEVSLDGKEYTTVSALGQFTSRRLDLEYTLRFSDLIEVDFTKNNTLFVRAQYADQCGEAYSEPLSITLWAKTAAPSIYQDKDSCHSDAVTIKTYDADKYQCTWVILDNEGQITWSYTQDSLKVRRVTDLNVTQYGVVGVDRESGCITPYVYFNIDSLPELRQEKMKELGRSICYGSTLNMEGGAISGGSGDKTFQWQYSYDGESFSDYATTQDLTMDNIRASVYVRRIVEDKCAVDTSNAIFVSVTKQLTMDPSALVFDDYKCEGQMFHATLDETIMDSLASVLGDDFTSLQVEIHDPATLFLERLGKGDMVELYGFEGRSNAYTVKLLGFLDSMKSYCESEPVEVVAHTASPISKDKNTISCETLSPCNETIVSIKGNVPVEANAEAKNFKYSWFTSKDGETWTKMLLQNGIGLDLEVIDTVYVKRTTSNGCGEQESNVLTFIGRKLIEVDYATELTMEVVTTQMDSSSSVTLVVGDNALDVIGDGELPTLSVGKNTLPYAAETYADSLLKIHKVGDGCYSTLGIEPLRGGRIHINGGGVVCPDEKVPPIVATELEGGDGEYTYQWQYMSEYVDEWINVPGAREKNYYPAASNVRMWYRRIAQSGIYTSYSNAVSVMIAPAVKVGYITTEQGADYFSEFGLEATDFSVHKTPDMTVTLTDSVKNSTMAFWEFSDDNENWEKAVSVTDADSEVQSLSINDSITQRFYRLVAINACGADTSEAFKVLTVNTPIIKDEELRIEPAKCRGDSAGLRCHIVDNAEYAYTYSGYGEMYLRERVNGRMTNIDITENDTVESFVYFRNVTKPLTITVKRISKITGVSTKREVVIPFTEFKADYTFSVNGVEYDQTATDVVMDQGSLVQFHNKTENLKPIRTYSSSSYWELIQAPNPELVPVGSRKYGLTSRQENPSCYFYNAGRYTITYIAESVDGCKDTLVNSALHIPADAVRALYVPAIAEFVEDGSTPSAVIPKAEVFPAVFRDELTIRLDDTEFGYTIHSVDGRTVSSGSGEGTEVVNTSSLPAGAYIVSVDGWHFKVVKE